METSRCQPLRGLPYWGGKNPGRNDRLGQWIEERLPPSKRYVEPFAGQLGVLLLRPKSHTEVVNDIDGRIPNWWRVVRDRPDELAAAIHDSPTARAEFDYCKQAQWDSTLADVERARCFAVVQCCKSVTSFRRSWISRTPSDWQTTVSSRVAGLSDRLRHVVIEQCDALELLELYVDCDDCVIYCDPPYKTTHHGKYESLPDYAAMTSLMLSAKAKIAVSGDPDDYPELTEAGWIMHTKHRWVGQPNHPARETVEALWFNYDPGTPPQSGGGGVNRPLLDPSPRLPGVIAPEVTLPA